MLSLDPSAQSQRSPTQAIRDLWLAVLVRAIEDLSHPSFSRPVVRWIEDKGVDPGSFEWVCEALGLDAGYLRQRLLKAIATPAGTQAHSS
jgi:hypothetical protein